MSDDDSLQRLARDVQAFADARDWAQFHDPKNLAMALASEVGELAGVLRWVANTDADSFARDPAQRERVVHEIADTAILLLLLCNRARVDLAEAVRQKLALNARKYPVELSKGKSEAPPSNA